MLKHTRQRGAGSIKRSTEGFGCQGDADGLAQLGDHGLTQQTPSVKAPQMQHLLRRQDGHRLSVGNVVETRSRDLVIERVVLCSFELDAVPRQRPELANAPATVTHNLVVRIAGQDQNSHHLAPPLLRRHLWVGAAVDEIVNWMLSHHSALTVCLHLINVQRHS